jgi:hypothetical protein
MMTMMTMMTTMMSPFDAVYADDVDHILSMSVSTVVVQSTVVQDSTV